MKQGPYVVPSKTFEEAMPEVGKAISPAYAVKCSNGQAYTLWIGLTPEAEGLTRIIMTDDLRDDLPVAMMINHTPGVPCFTLRKYDPNYRIWDDENLHIPMMPTLIDMYVAMILSATLPKDVNVDSVENINDKRSLEATAAIRVGLKPEELEVIDRVERLIKSLDTLSNGRSADEEEKEVVEKLSRVKTTVNGIDLWAN